MELKKTISLVTGARTGLGKYIALALAQKGSTVVAASRSISEDDDLFQPAEQESNGMIIPLRLDVRDFSQVKQAIQSVIAQYGKLDILINNAGVTRDASIARMTEEDWDAVIDTNLKGTFNCTRAVMKPMLKQRQGKIINIASIAGVVGNPGQANYSAAKAGVIGFTKAVAAELGSRGININVVASGLLDVGIGHQLDKKYQQRFKDMIPMARLGTAQDIVETVLFLATGKSNYITGQTIVVDGGMTSVPLK
jgi:3-oxoacyl-[acyl-carrier protein] reductase